MEAGLLISDRPDDRGYLHNAGVGFVCPALIWLMLFSFTQRSSDVHSIWS